MIEEGTKMESLESSNIYNQPSTSSTFDQKTPHAPKHSTPIETRKRSRCSELGDVLTPNRLQHVPIPPVAWANNQEIWQTMVYKEEATSRTRNCKLFEDPSSFLPRMRSILVDWIMEVCEVYRLRRMTFYLAVDYIDRYLSLKPATPKQHLQLVGISALFIAAKLEEIYPPKLKEFSYVCDGACSDEDILNCEILILNSLIWDVNPMTPTGWLNLYMQIYYDNRTKDSFRGNQGNGNDNFLFPKYSSYQFIKASHLIDLLSFDPGYLLFNYSIIAASAMYFMFGRTVALKVSGLTWDELKDCTEYMAVYYTIIRSSDDPRLQFVTAHTADERLDPANEAMKSHIAVLTTNEIHSMQTHIVDLQYFEKATLLRLQRMGLHVKKVIYTNKDTLKKQNDESLNTNQEATDGCNEVSTDDTSKEESEHEDEKPPIVLFEIQQKSSVATEQSTTNTSHTKAHDMSFFTTKKQYTFDEILVGIHNFTSKVLFHSKDESDVEGDL